MPAGELWPEPGWPARSLLGGRWDTEGGRKEGEVVVTLVEMPNGKNAEAAAPARIKR